jgi:LmbE family N-acetylglucosaminyl deacetylase
VLRIARPGAQSSRLAAAGAAGLPGKDGWSDGWPSVAVGARHPDDESSMTGATMASYARQGATVALVTCTRGEIGEIVASDLAGLRDADPDGLALRREAGLAEALAVLGTARHHWLGGCGRWRDSGIPAGRPTCWPACKAPAWRAPDEFS